MFAAACDVALFLLQVSKSSGTSRSYRFGNCVFLFRSGVGGGEGSETISLHTQKKNPLSCFASRQNSLTVSPDTARELWSLWTSRGESHGSIRHTGGAMWIKLEEQEGAGAQGRAPALQRVREKSLEHARTPRSLKILGVPGLTVCWVTPFPSTLWQLASVFHPRGSSQTF